VRVLVLSHTYLRRFNQRKWEAFADLAASHAVCLVVPDAWHDPHFGRVIPEPPTHTRVHLQVARALFRGHGTLTFHVDPRLVSTARRFHPEFVMVEQEPHSLLALQGRWLARLLPGRPPFSFFTWGSPPDRRRPWPLRILERSTLGAASLAFAGNHAASDRLRTAGFHGPIHRIPQVGVDLPDRPGATRTRIRSDLGLSGLVVGFAGRLVPEKGVLDLMEALIGLEPLSWTLLVIGRGPLAESIELRFSQAKLAGRLRLVDEADHHRVVALMTALDVLVLPSYATADWAEQFGHVLIEAMAAGCPVVGTDSGEVPHIIGDAGIVVPERDIGQLRAVLQRLTKDSTLRARLGEQGRARVARHFTHSQVAQRLARCLEQSLAEQQGSPGT
jgi:glycosyltransferase involved in cell wall biosynthesis